MALVVAEDFEPLQIITFEGEDVHGRQIVRVVGKYFPAPAVDVEKLKAYVRQKLHHELPPGPYVLVYFHTLVQRSDNSPGLWALRDIYETLPNQLKHRMQAVYVVHPGLRSRVVLATLGRVFLSEGFYSKLVYISRLEFLLEYVRKGQVDIPDFVIEHDNELETRPLMDYGLEADPLKNHETPRPLLSLSRAGCRYTKWIQITLLVRHRGRMLGTPSDGAVLTRRDAAVIRHARGERHDRRGVGDIGDGNASWGAVVGVGAGVGAPGARADVVVPGEGVAAVAALCVVALQLLEPVRLHHGHLVAQALVVVVALGLVDMPEAEAAAGQVRVAAVALPIFHQEVLRVRRAVLPHLQHLVAVLHILDPPLVHLTPSARLSRIIPVPVVRPRPHEAPAPNPGGAGVSIIKIRPPEQKMANLMSTNAQLPIRRHSQVLEAREDLLPHLGVWRNEAPGLHCVWGCGCGVHVLFLQECGRSGEVRSVTCRNVAVRERMCGFSARKSRRCEKLRRLLEELL